MKCKTLVLILGIAQFVFTFIFVLSSAVASMAQSTAQPRIKQAVDGRMIRLIGNTHPLARSEFDRGPAPDSLPAERIPLLSQRGPGHEAEIRQLLEDQQTKSPRYYHDKGRPGDLAEFQRHGDGVGRDTHRDGATLRRRRGAGCGCAVDGRVRDDQHWRAERRHSSDQCSIRGEHAALAEWRGNRNGDRNHDGGDCDQSGVIEQQRNA